eukprot:2587730-Pyramimonas_sp.AAC.1
MLVRYERLADLVLCVDVDVGGGQQSAGHVDMALLCGAVQRGLPKLQTNPTPATGGWIRSLRGVDSQPQGVD